MGGVIGDARKRQAEVAAEQVLTAPLPVDDMRAQYQQQVSAAYDEVDRLTDRGRQLAAEVTRQTARAESLLEESRRQHARADALEVERDEARQTCCACHSVARLERDEARANRDRLAHENAALRRQVADAQQIARLAEESEAGWRRSADELAERVADLTAERDRARLSRDAAKRATVRQIHARKAAERALAARDEVIARWESDHARLSNEWARERAWANKRIRELERVIAQIREVVDVPLLPYGSRDIKEGYDAAIGRVRDLLSEEQ